MLDDDKRMEDGTLDPEVLERISKVEEGPPSPLAAPKSGPPLTTRVPKQKVLPSEQSPSNPTRRGDYSSRERKYPASAAGGVGSYFPPSHPRRLTIPPSFPRWLTIPLSKASPTTAKLTPSTCDPGDAEIDVGIEVPHGMYCDEIN
jgi:hypothetical protein